MQLLRKRRVGGQLDLSNRGIDGLVERHLLTRPIRLNVGKTSPSLWPAHEVDAVVRARIAGQSEEQIRALVARLEADRLQAAA